MSSGQNPNRSSIPAAIIRKPGTSDIYRKPRYSPRHYGRTPNENGAKTRQMTSRIREETVMQMQPTVYLGTISDDEAPAMMTPPVAGTSTDPEAAGPVAGTTIQIGNIKFETRAEEGEEEDLNGDRFEVDAENGGIDMADEESASEGPEVGPPDLKQFASQQLFQHDNEQARNN